MKTIALLDFFKVIEYDYKKDLEQISEICYYTKTRADPNVKEFKLTRGCEQPFLIKAIAEWSKANNFFEIGTGRGTASYSVALCDNIKDILTIDLILYEQKIGTAIGHKAVNASLKDIFEMIKGEDKNKIQFFGRDQFKSEDLNKYCFDFCFIDGDHTQERVIRRDFNICNKIVKRKGLFVFDDYGPERFAIKNIVDKLIPEFGFNSLLVEFHGHLFGGEKEQNEGLVIMKRGKII